MVLAVQGYDMSLLTNEQIVELIGITLGKKSTSRDLHDEFHEWNKKQSTKLEVTHNQFIGLDVTPYWEKAPTGAIKAAFSMCWYDENDNLLLSDIFEEFPKPIRPHPHAEMIMKYAEVAQRRVDPWVEFEVRHTYAPSNSWFKMDTNRWISSSPDFEYRHIGETK
jgi:hypothetical protein